MRTFETADGSKYTFICSAHDDIKDFAEKIINIVDVAKDMGINMEDYLNRRKTAIEEMEQEISDLKKEVKKLKLANKKMKERRKIEQS